MRIDNNLNAMISGQLQMNKLADNIANVANDVGDTEFQESSTDFLNSMVEQIPTAIAYEANANAIKVKNAVADTILDIKA